MNAPFQQKGYTFSALPDATLRVLSLGAGVQSTVMALMACKGEIGPRPDVMIFADTGWEPPAIYEHLWWLAGEVDRLTNGRVPVLITSKGNIRADVLANKNTTGQTFSAMPFMTTAGGRGRRQCTKEYKIEPIQRVIRRLLGVGYRKRVPSGVMVEKWMGITKDEAQRMSPSRDKWAAHRYPLIELDWTRQHCLIWWNDNYPGRSLVKSACVGCPYRDNASWKNMRDTDPPTWADAVEFDHAIRDGGTLRGMREKQFLHRSLLPLDQAPIDDQDNRQADMFGEECEGMCGV